MVREQHLGDIQWYFSLLSLILIQLAAVCNLTENLTYLFIICPPVVLSFLTLKIPSQKGKGLFTIITQKDKGASIALAIDWRTTKELATKFKTLAGFSCFYLVCLQGKNLQTSLSDLGDEDVSKNCPSSSRSIGNSSDANIFTAHEKTKEKVCEKCRGFWSRNGSYVNTQGPQCSLESTEIWEKWQSDGK